MKKCGICGYDITGYEAECWSGIYDRVHVSCCARKLDELYKQLEAQPTPEKPEEVTGVIRKCDQCGVEFNGLYANGHNGKQGTYCMKCSGYQELEPQEAKPSEKEEDYDPYCPICGTCGYVGCCGIENWLEKHIKGKTNCTHEESMIEEIKDLYKSAWEDEDDKVTEPPAESTEETEMQKSEREGFENAVDALEVMAGLKKIVNGKAVPITESTEVEEIERMGGLDGVSSVVRAEMAEKKIDELVAGFNRLAKEIKQKAEKIN